MINFINIKLKLNSRILFENFNFSIEKGEKAALKGRSGRGKTTLFNMIMGFSKPDSGKIIFDSNELSMKNIREIRKRISWLPQNSNIIGRGRVKEQVMIPFRFSANKHLLPDNRILEEELEKINLEKSILDSSFDEISGGEKQRIGIMICRLLKRDLMLLDEPTSALDKENLNAVIDYLCAEKETTILSASHDEEWLKHCNNVIEI
ncbi:ATP-binding cassette domain-containing protein [Bacteroidota bacterium]